MILWSAASEGPTAVPGTYQVKLTANGVTQTAALKVEADPRVEGVTQADLQKQFDLASKVRAEEDQVNKIVGNIRGIRKEVEADVKADPSLKPAADALLTPLETIEKTIYQTQNRSGQDPLNFSIRLNNYIGALARVVMSGDSAPTAQTYTVDEELAARVVAQQTAYDAVVSSGLKDFNAQAEKKKLKPITPHLIEADAK